MVQVSRKLPSLHPSWPHYLGLLSISTALLAGFARYFLIDRHDPLHCDSLLNTGSWLDEDNKQWQPDGCMLHSYKPDETSTCLASKRVVFIGDSITRTLYFQFAHSIDPKLPASVPDDRRKHSDHSLISGSGTMVDFYWDPYLNTSHVTNFLKDPVPSVAGGEAEVPALLVLGSGLWYLRYTDSSGGLPAWEANVENILNTVEKSRSPPAEMIVFLPVEEVVSDKLSPERSETMHASDIDAMNSDLYHRIHPASSDPLALLSSTARTSSVHLPLVFNQMLDASQTMDGLHFENSVVKTQANVLLNLRCNNAWAPAFPFDKTCCRAYPWPSFTYLVLLCAVFSWGPAKYMLARRRGETFEEMKKGVLPAIIFSGAFAMIFVADRTSYWNKEQKYYDTWSFAALNACALLVGLATLKRTDKDLGFLNRDQTDEWKGWMQIAILIYHYLGASKISGIYNPIRVLVAAYLFMTGYGHTTFYAKKADFGFSRITQVLVRLNILTLILAYTMNTDYLSYYFAPLVSMWYLIIYATMAIGSQFNDRMPLLLGKIVTSMCLFTAFMKSEWPLQLLFGFLEYVFDIRWSAREWTFRVTLDQYIVYFGMLAALAVIKVRDYRLTDHPLWPLTVKVSVGLSGLAMLWFFVFELDQESKFTYNGWHPYVSFIPITAFVILRNASPLLRSCSSRAYTFIGKCSLETFIIQFHLWLAADTKGVLLVLPGTKWRHLNFVVSTILFVYVSDQVAQASGEVTSWICGGGKDKGLPTSNTASSGRGAGSNPSGAESVPLTSQQTEHDKPAEAREPDTPTRPLRWVDRLAEGPPRLTAGSSLWTGAQKWEFGVKTKLATCMAVMWLLNLLWVYP
ncbi:hypothetical protein CONPUDRAFT_79031 [Coniophora puteana RWD-64-598 SS2]|uniref:Cas1p 10 TM acyl transferase domain-containing protein n=1 Tax=Coniophora puteana (strain RWD-64-598) TaxID=741705 RepID=A0A5M3N9F0_CONPW|nr:uncharacterized protein CONPUDRAFT_79031 [Coniophora puteana RWD-64-598 SS2]EIW87471.1 hypothetical protein CONPUDRAFT_79031 [Coniophora puteana RWD-64-598 SS2]